MEDLDKHLDDLIGGIEYGLSKSDLDTISNVILNKYLLVRILKNQAMLLEYFSVSDKEVFTDAVKEKAQGILDEHMKEIIENTQNGIAQVTAKYAKP